MTAEPSFLRKFLIAVVFITPITAFPLPSNALDRISLIKLKPLNTLTKCEGCYSHQIVQNTRDIERVMATEFLNIKANSFPKPQKQNLIKDNSISQNQYAQNFVQKVNISEGRAIFLQLLKNPADLQLNIKYAESIEARGKLNLAIATYRRLILLDPNNKTRWEDNIERLLDLLAPPETAVAAVLGTRISTNGPLNPDGNGNQSGYNESIVVTLDHKRKLGDLKYQLTGQVYADINAKNGASDLILTAFQFGPLLRIPNKWQFRPAFLFDRSSTNRRERGFFSSSAGTLFNFVNLDKGPIRTVDLSLFHANFNNESDGKDSIIFTSTSGLEYQGLKKSDLLRLAPNFVFNGAKSGAGSDGFRDLYYELGFGTEYVRKISEDIEIGPTFSYYYRDYIDYQPEGSTKRDDHNFNIGLQATATNIIPDMVILASYSFERNKSNLADETYRNHSISISFVKSF